MHLPSNFSSVGSIGVFPAEIVLAAWLLGILLCAALPKIEAGQRVTWALILLFIPRIFGIPAFFLFSSPYGLFTVVIREIRNERKKQKRDSETESRSKTPVVNWWAKYH